QKFTPRRGNTPSRFEQLERVYSHCASSSAMSSIRCASARTAGAKTDSDLVATRPIFTFPLPALWGLSNPGPPVAAGTKHLPCVEFEHPQPMVAASRRIEDRNHQRVRRQGQ